MKYTILFMLTLLFSFTSSQKEDESKSVENHTFYFLRDKKPEDLTTAISSVYELKVDTADFININISRYKYLTASATRIFKLDGTTLSENEYAFDQKHEFAIGEGMKEVSIRFDKNIKEKGTLVLGIETNQIVNHPYIGAFNSISIDIIPADN